MKEKEDTQCGFAADSDEARLGKIWDHVCTFMVQTHDMKQKQINPSSSNFPNGIHLVPQTTSLGSPVFLPPQKSTFLNSNSIMDEDHKFIS
jgi:hypothetical protein